MEMPHCLKLERQFARLAFSLALDNAGRSIAARIAMIAITTRSSINVNARVRSPIFVAGHLGIGNQTIGIEWRFYIGLGVRGQPDFFWLA